MKKNVAKALVMIMMGVTTLGLMSSSGCSKEEAPDITGGGSTGGGSTGGGSTGGGNTGTSQKDSWAYLVNEDKKEFKVVDKGKDGKIMTYGQHTYSIIGDLSLEDYNEDAKGHVTFSNIPSGYTEFSTVYNELLSHYPQGVVAMVPMAMEIYARDRATGEKCLKLICTSTCYSEAIREISRKFNHSKYSPENDQYIQRFLPAALLQGAHNKNAYKPDEPYTVNLVAKPDTPHEDTELLGGTVMYMYLMSSGGWSTPQRDCQVFGKFGQEKNGPFKMFSFPAFYTQCQTCRGTWEGLK